MYEEKSHTVTKSKGEATDEEKDKAKIEDNPTSPF